MSESPKLPGAARLVPEPEPQFFHRGLPGAALLVPTGSREEAISRFYYQPQDWVALAAAAAGAGAGGEDENFADE